MNIHVKRLLFKRISKSITNKKSKRADEPLSMLFVRLVDTARKLPAVRTMLVLKTILLR